MRRPFAVGIFAILIWAEIATSSALAQMPPRGRELDREREEALKEFATRVRRIALHYDQAGDREKAKGTLRLLLQTLPNDQEAKALLEKISKQELSENKTFVKVLANQGWQNTGLQVIAGKPVVIEAKGTWVFRMNRVVSADGLEVPDDMRDFPLGSLVGLIEPVAESVAVPPPRDTKASSPTVDDMLGLPPIDIGPDKESTRVDKKTNSTKGSRPFLIGSKRVFTPSATGTLLLKIHDTREADNSGELTVTVSGQVRLQSGSVAHGAKGQK